MYREAGVRTFFRGLVPTMIQVFPLAGFQFGFYALFKHVWEFFLPVHVDASVHETSKCRVVDLKGLEHPPGWICAHYKSYHYYYY